MKKKLLIALVVVLLATLITATPTFAWYSSVSGTVLDSTTAHSPWTHGGTVTVRDCSTWASLGTGPISTSDGTFSVGVSGAPTNPPGYLCVEIAFTCSDPECVSTPPTKWLIIQSLASDDDEGDYSPPPSGNIYTDSGPNVVTLAEADTGSPNAWLPVALGVVALVGAGGAVLLLRRRRVA
jgi:hypothetical protein